MFGFYCYYYSFSYSLFLTKLSLPFSNRDLLYFFFGKEIDKELSSACAPPPATPLSPTTSQKEDVDEEKKERGAEEKRRDALVKERKRKVEVAEKREREEREKVVEVNKAIPVLLELQKVFFPFLFLFSFLICSCIPF